VTVSYRLLGKEGTWYSAYLLLKKIRCSGFAMITNPLQRIANPLQRFAHPLQRNSNPLQRIANPLPFILCFGGPQNIIGLLLQTSFIFLIL
jgi:hypothetical protein